jgi:DNA (cytosine-5)-methyltransferase 1
MDYREDDLALIGRVLEIYDQKFTAEYLNGVGGRDWCRESLNRLIKGKLKDRELTRSEHKALEALLPQPPAHHPNYHFKFIDLFAGIGGIRRAFDKAGGKCVFTSEWNAEAVRTYKANHYCDPAEHRFNEDIRKVTRSDRADISEGEAYRLIDEEIPDHDVLLAGFPCQPFSIAGVSKKNALGRAHGFECKTQGTLFFDVARILRAKRPAAFLLENVKNLKSHDKGRTFATIMETLDELGYWVADADARGGQDPKVIDAQNFLPQHRERIVLVGFRKDLNVHEGFTLHDVRRYHAKRTPRLSDILEKSVDPKYILTPKLWEYLYNYSAKHKEKGNGFGYGLVGRNSIARTLSARYYKDGSEILIDRGFDSSKELNDPENLKNRPRRLTPTECARLMGFIDKNGNTFRIPVSDTQAYKQFGNSVVVPVFAAVADLMKDRIMLARQRALQGMALAA